MLKYSTFLYHIPLYAQVFAQAMAQLPAEQGIIKTLVDAGAVTVLAIALVILAYAILQQSRNKSKDEEAENMRLSTVLENINKMVDGLIEDRVHSRQVIESNSESQRLMTAAINENTGSNRQMNTTMDSMAREFKSYTSLHSDSVEQLVGRFNSFEERMVAFGGQLTTAIEKINHNAGDHTDISNLVQKAIEEMLVHKLDLLSAINKATPTPIEAHVTVHPPKKDEPPPLEATG